MIAPTERSMPAVRTTRVCAEPTMPTIATCCRISVSAKGEKNFDPRTAPKIATESTSTISGTSAGLECSTCWIRSINGLSCRSKDATSVALSFRTFSNSWDGWVLASAIVSSPNRWRPGAPAASGEAARAGRLKGADG